MLAWTRLVPLSSCLWGRLAHLGLLVLVGALLLLLVGCRTVSDPPSDGTGQDDVSAASDTDARAEQISVRAAPTQPPDAGEHAGVGRHRLDAGRAVFDLTNEVRTDRGRGTLTPDSTLAQSACWHNQDMLVHDYLGHRDASGRTPGDRVAREHRRLIGTAGENVADGEPLPADASREDAAAWAGAVVKRWMNSDGHRSNLLRSQFTHLGTCVTHTASVARATQLFATAWAYLDEPLPWTMSVGDSLAISVTPNRAQGAPEAYAFVPPTEPLGRAFDGDDARRAFQGTLHLPDSAGVYGSRFLFMEGEGRYVVISGPRVQVE